MNILIHGFNVSDYNSTIGKLAKFLNPSFVFDYGWFGVLSVLFRNKSEAKKLHHKINMFRNVGQEKIVVYGHSNGCAIAVESARQGANIDVLVCINPALKVDLEFPESIKRIIVIHTKHDKPTQTARFLDKIPIVQILVPNAWGAMGARGSSSVDNRVENIDLSDRLSGHSDFFMNSKLSALMPEVMEIVNEPATY